MLYYLLEIEIAAKSLLTHGACVWLLFVVGVHMKGQIVHLKRMINSLKRFDEYSKYKIQ